jgi:hypothetical protein
MNETFSTTVILNHQNIRALYFNHISGEMLFYLRSCPKIVRNDVFELKGNRASTLPSFYIASLRYGSVIRCVACDLGTLTELSVILKRLHIITDAELNLFHNDRTPLTIEPDFDPMKNVATGLYTLLESDIKIYYWHVLLSNWVLPVRAGADMNLLCYFQRVPEDVFEAWAISLVEANWMVPDPLESLRRFQRSYRPTAPMIPEGYVQVKKCICTPTRIIYLPRQVSVGYYYYYYFIFFSPPTLTLY